MSVSVSSEIVSRLQMWNECYEDILEKPADPYKARLPPGQQPYPSQLYTYTKTTRNALLTQQAWPSNNDIDLYITRLLMSSKISVKLFPTISHFHQQFHLNHQSQASTMSVSTAKIGPALLMGPGRERFRANKYRKFCCPSSGCDFGKTYPERLPKQYVL